MSTKNLSTPATLDQLTAAVTALQATVAALQQQIAQHMSDVQPLLTWWQSASQQAPVGRRGA